MMYRDPMRIFAYVTLLCTTIIATAQCMDGADLHSPGATIDVIHLGGDVAVDENQSNTLHNLRDDLAAKDSKALTNELRSDDKPYSSTFLQAIENMTYFPTQIIRALHMFSVPIEHMQTTINFALIPRASLPWIQTTGASLCIDNSYNILSESKVLTTLDDADFAQRVQAAIETQNEVEARTVFHAYVDYHFSLANPMRERTTDTYVMERTLLFDELAFSNSFMYLEADFRVASTDPRCMGKHSIVVLLNIQYDKSAYVEEEDRFAPVPDDGEEVNNSDVDHHLDAKGEKFLLGAEEVTLISLVTSLTNEVTMAQLYAQEASPFYGRLRRVVIRIRITTKCPEAIHLYNLFYEIRILDIDAPIDFLKNNTGLVPVSALPPFLAKEEENFLHITNRKVVMISSKIDTQLVEWFEVRSIRVGPVPDVSFYILPKRRPGSNAWSIWFGATAHIDYRGSVKITLSCPAKATQLHLQSGDLRSLVIHGFNIMTGVFPDAHHPNEQACDEVLVELSFPRRSFVLGVENLFFLCNHGPCKYKRTGLFHEDSHTTLQTIQNTSTPRKTTIRSIPYSALLPHSESPIAATKPRSPLRFKEGRTRRPRYVIGLAFGLSLLGFMVGATIFLVFSRSRRLLSHSRRMISVDCVFDKSSGGFVLETLKDSEDVHIMCKYPGASGDDLDGFHTLRTNTTCSTCLNH